MQSCGGGSGGDNGVGGGKLEWAGRAAHRQGLQLVERGNSWRPADLDHIPHFSLRDMASTSGVTAYTTATFNVGFFGWDDDEGCSKL